MASNPKTDLRDKVLDLVPGLKSSALAIEKKIDRAMSSFENYQESKKTLGEIKQGIDKLIKRRDELNEETSQLERAVSDLRGKENRYRDVCEGIKSAEKTLDKLGKEIKSCKNEVNQLKTESSQEKEELSKTKKALKEAELRKEREIAEAKSTLVQLGGKIEETEDICAEKQKELKKIISEINNAFKRKAELDKYTNDIEQNLIALKSQEEAAQKELVDLKDQKVLGQIKREKELNVLKESLAVQEKDLKTREQWLREKAVSLRDMKSELEKSLGHKIDLKI